MTTRSLESVERLMVVDPRVTSAAELLVRVTAADVVIRDVTIDPAEFVVVTSIVVGTVEVGDAACVISEVPSELGVVLPCVEVGVVSAVVGVVS